MNVSLDMPIHTRRNYAIRNYLHSLRRINWVNVPFVAYRYQMMGCCSKIICDGCSYANKKREIEQWLRHRCAFCREQKIQKKESRESSQRVVIFCTISVNYMSIVKTSSWILLGEHINSTLLCTETERQVTPYTHYLFLTS